MAAQLQVQNCLTQPLGKDTNGQDMGGKRVLINLLKEMFNIWPVQFLTNLYLEIYLIYTTLAALFNNLFIFFIFFFNDGLVGFWVKVQMKSYFCFMEKKKKKKDIIISSN